MALSLKLHMVVWHMDVLNYTRKRKKSHWLDKIASKFGKNKPNNLTVEAFNCIILCLFHLTELFLKRLHRD